MTAATLRRTTGLTRANALLMVRNGLTLIYAVALPLLPMANLFLAERGDVNAGIGTVNACLMLALLFPVYYNLLSMTVTRRDELVLKRLRTGETRDVELLTSMALPGAAVTGVVCVLLLVVGLALGQPVPLNPPLFAVMVIAAVVAFSALALWTAAWTRNAEAAQLTSTPVLVLAFVGMIRPVIPERFLPYVGLTPGAAVDELVRIAWFGQSYDGPVDLASSWGAAVSPLLVLVAWAALAIVLAQRSMRWEPRS